MIRLTKTENIALRHLLAFESNKEIASAMGISVRTVKFHLGNIYRKIGVPGRSELFKQSVEVKVKKPC